MKLLLFVPLLLLTVQCSPPQPVNPIQTNPPDNPVLTDTIPVVSTPTDTRAFAVQILEDKASVQDNDPVNACLDSLKSADPAVRNFYWKVFRVILRDSDGALSETLGSRLIELLHRNTQEFVAQYEICDMTIRAQCTSFMAYEKWMDEATEQAIDDEFRSLKADCKNCLAEQTVTLDDICREIKKTIRWYRKKEQ